MVGADALPLCQVAEDAALDEGRVGNFCALGQLDGDQPGDELQCIGTRSEQALPGYYRVTGVCAKERGDALRRDPDIDRDGVSRLC